MKELFGLLGFMMLYPYIVLLIMIGIRMLSEPTKKEPTEKESLEKIKHRRMIKYRRMETYYNNDNNLYL